jgi:tripartite-type tricarboxylate transporter receptor subunit TctC
MSPRKLCGFVSLREPTPVLLPLPSGKRERATPLIDSVLLFLRGVTVISFVLITASLNAPASAQSVSFAGKTVTMMIGYAPGGGTDASGRVIASFLDKYLPGSPTVVVRNMPGADGMTAANYFVQQVAPDGLTILMCSSTTADPLAYRRPQSHFDPTRFGIIGGVGRGASFLIANRDVEARLADKHARTVVMGTIGGVPRSGMQMAAWGIGFLDWNARWVVGYRGTNDVMLALERGEIDMTATANLFQLQKLIETGRVKLMVQTGVLKNGVTVTRPEFPNVPTLAKLLQGRLKDPLAAKAFEYWSSIATIDKFLALPPNTPMPVLDAYRAAFARVMRDPEFVERGKAMSEDFEPMASADVQALVNTLGEAPSEAINYLGGMLRKQGLDVQ